MKDFHISISKPDRRNRSLILEVEGRIDTGATTRLREALRSFLKDGFLHMIVDLSEVDYVSSAGWGVLLSETMAYRKKGGDLCLAGLSAHAREMFDLLELHCTLQTYPSTKEALEAVPPGG